MLVQQGLASSRNRAQSYIIGGAVFCDSELVKNPSQPFPITASLHIKEKDHPFVSRGGVKLKEALSSFNIDVRDKICLDVGASTGGFTDCLLKEGARKVYAVDVGYGQLNWALRKDPRVVIFEKTNFRYFDCFLIREVVELVTIDVSFISLTKIIPKALQVLEKCNKSKRHILVLIKPQFEAGKNRVGKGGIVKDEKVISACVEKIKNFFLENGLNVLGIARSPILGRDGNQEYLMSAQ